MASYVSVLNPSTNNVEGHQKWLNRLYGPGVATHYLATSLQVVQRGAGANLSVDISIGDAILQLPSLLASYWCWTDSATNATITTADATNPRIDAVVAWVDPTAASTGNTNSLGAFKFMIVAGTAAGSPTAPADATIQTAVGASNAWLRLANVTVAAGATTITNAVITDTRIVITPLTNNTLTKTTNPYKFSVYRAGAWTDGNGGFALVTFDTVEFDTGSNYSTSTGRFTAPVNGFYDFTAFTSSALTAANLYSIAFYKNGSLLKQGPTGGNASINVSQRGFTSPPVQLVTGDYIQVYSFGTGGAGNTGSSATYFGGKLISAT